MKALLAVGGDAGGGGGEVCLALINSCWNIVKIKELAGTILARDTLLFNALLALPLCEPPPTAEVVKRAFAMLFLLSSSAGMPPEYLSNHEGALGDLAQVRIRLEGMEGLQGRTAGERMDLQKALRYLGDVEGNVVGTCLVDAALAGEVAEIALVDGVETLAKLMGEEEEEREKERVEEERRRVKREEEEEERRKEKEAMEEKIRRAREEEEERRKERERVEKAAEEALERAKDVGVDVEELKAAAEPVEVEVEDRKAVFEPVEQAEATKEPQNVLPSLVPTQAPPKEPDNNASSSVSLTRKQLRTPLSKSIPSAPLASYTTLDVASMLYVLGLKAHIKKVVACNGIDGRALVEARGEEDVKEMGIGIGVNARRVWGWIVEKKWLDGGESGGGRRKELRTLTAEDVGKELGKMGCGRYRARWNEEGVDGETLLYTSSRKELEKLGVMIEGHRGKIWERIEQWKILGVESTELAV
ncbi:hypothetical protein TrRE_jg4180 [Triparma retinervis]|uniref:SAM domain-containing protein n=1 Tax=Triparma retinervis TaxID=2557542 RepID=A0A9W7EG20_9STRA|nr:hypothetical protein TrRE_jg4180 [Triparma retinervis]